MPKSAIACKKLEESKVTTRGADRGWPSAPTANAAADHLRQMTFRFLKSMI
jgi:hypothetical protein